MCLMKHQVKSVCIFNYQSFFCTHWTVLDGSDANFASSSRLVIFESCCLSFDPGQQLQSNIITNRAWRVKERVSLLSHYPPPPRLAKLVVSPNTPQASCTFCRTQKINKLIVGPANVWRSGRGRSAGTGFKRRKCSPSNSVTWWNVLLP